MHVIIDLWGDNFYAMFVITAVDMTLVLSFMLAGNNY